MIGVEEKHGIQVTWIESMGKCPKNLIYDG